MPALKTDRSIESGFIQNVLDTQRIDFCEPPKLTGPAFYP